MASFELAELSVEVVRKDIKNIHLSVLPPDGHVRLAAPHRLRTEALRAYTLSRLAWIREQQIEFCEQEREAPRRFVDRETHYVWGERRLLELRSTAQGARVEVTPDRLLLHVRPGTDEERRADIVNSWYRSELRSEIAEVLPRWTARLGVSPTHIYLQRMKTKWGSCNHTSRTIRLNSDLAKKPRKCFEYILVHELCHLIEPTHNQRFVDVLSEALPSWRDHRDLLNRLPLSHEEWDY